MRLLFLWIASHETDRPQPVPLTPAIDSILRSAYAKAFLGITRHRCPHGCIKNTEAGFISASLNPSTEAALTPTVKAR